jgi:AcrR family transcriptional regulator
VGGSYNVMRQQVGRNGQMLKAKGSKTQRKIMDATTALIRKKPLRDLTVAEIARTAAISTSTFYLYFEDVASVALALIAQITQRTPNLFPLVLEDWKGDAAFGHALNFIRTYTEVWSTHRDLLRARNLAAEEGDARFALVRRKAVRPLLNLFAERVAELQRLGHAAPYAQPAPVAAALITLLERVSAFGPLNPEETGVTREDMLVATAHIFATTLREQP